MSFQTNCPNCGSKETTLTTIVHETQGKMYGVPVPGGRGNRVTFILRCVTEWCLYSKMAYEEKAFEMEDIT